MSFVLDPVTFIISTHHKPLKSCLLFSHFHLTEQAVMHSVRAPTSKATLINMGHNNTISPHHQAGVKAWKPYNNKSERLVLLNQVIFFFKCHQKKHQQQGKHNSAHAKDGILYICSLKDFLQNVLWRSWWRIVITHTHTLSLLKDTIYILFSSLTCHFAFPKMGFSELTRWTAWWRIPQFPQHRSPLTSAS